MSKLRDVLSPSTADRYYVNWTEGDLVASMKNALRVRKFTLRLDYTTHTPMLFIGKPDGTEFLWRILDTREFHNLEIQIPEKEVDIRAFVTHVSDSLGKLGFKLTLGHKKDKHTKKQTAMVMLLSDESRHWGIVMFPVPKGGSKRVNGEV